jgi:hypothetical protein
MILEAGKSKSMAHLVRAFVLCHNMMKGQSKNMREREREKEKERRKHTRAFFFCFLFMRQGIIIVTTHYVAQAGLKFVILLPQPPEYWDYRPVPPCPE